VSLLVSLDRSCPRHRIPISHLIKKSKITRDVCKKKCIGFSTIYFLSLHHSSEIILHVYTMISTLSLSPDHHMHSILLRRQQTEDSRQQTARQLQYLYIPPTDPKTPFSLPPSASECVHCSPIFLIMKKNPTSSVIVMDAKLRYHKVVLEYPANLSSERFVL